MSARPNSEIDLHHADHQFQQAMMATGLTEAPTPVPGQLMRFPGADKGRSNKAGWCILFDDLRGGVFGDYATGDKQNWQANGATPYTQAERTRHSSAIAAAKAKRDAGKLDDQQQASERAVKLWNAATPCTQHPYLTAKGVQGYGVRVDADGFLIVPMRDTAGRLWNIERINPVDFKDKRGLPGGRRTGLFHLIGGTPADRIIGCEGYSTGASIHEATGDAVAVAFNAGNLEAVALALHGAYPSVVVVAAADDDIKNKVNTGMVAAQQAAQAVGGLVAVPDFGKNRPDGATDFNDLHQIIKGSEGLDAISVCIQAAKPAKAATAAPEPHSEYEAYSECPNFEFEDVEGQVKQVPVVAPVHALAKFVDFDTKPKATSWVIPGFIAAGVAVIAGAPGVGKTTALLPLAMTVAGLHGADCEFKPKHWRHVVYIVEDLNQALQIQSGYVAHGRMGIDPADVRERLHIVEGRRMSPAEVVSVGKDYVRDLTRSVTGADGRIVQVPPLVVIDTVAATLALNNENDNAEVSAMMASVKQGFAGLSVWLVAHLAKVQNGSTNSANMTSRGASAFGGDAHHELFLINENGQRQLVRGKTRAASVKWERLLIELGSATEMAEDEYGDMEETTLHWGVCTAPGQSRQQDKEQAQQQAAKDANTALRGAILNAVEQAHADGHPLNRAGVKSLIGGKTATVAACLQNLLNDRWLYEVPVPTADRLPNKASFLVKLSTPEHEAYRETGELPTAKLVVPASYKKPV